MVESFSGNHKDSNFIEGTKIMENFSDNNKNGSSIFQGKIREQDFSAEQKLNELKVAIEKLDRQDLLRRLECERQVSSYIDEISSQAELHIKDDEGYFDGEREKVLGDFWNFFESLFNLFEVDLDPQDYQMLKEKKEKNLIVAIMKFLRDKLKELIKKIFTSNLDLSWDKSLDKEIKELQERFGSGELSEEEFARALERLTALQDLKLKLQLAVTGWIITMFAEMFGVELTAIVEASTEKEDEKAEKTSLKEENKEVCENVKMKVDEREKPKVLISLFDVSPGFVRPVVLSKPEQNLLPDSLKIPMDLSHRQVINNENNKSSQESRVKEKEVKPENPIVVCPPKPAEKKPVVSGIKFTKMGTGESAGFEKRRPNTSVNGRGTTSTNTTNGFNEKELKPTNEQKFDGKESKSTNKQETGDSYAKLAKKVAERNAQRKESATIKQDYPIDNWQAPSGTTDNGKSSADQRSSASNAKENPKSKFTDVFKERAARGNGNTPSR